MAAGERRQVVDWWGSAERLGSRRWSSGWAYDRAALLGLASLTETR